MEVCESVNINPLFIDCVLESVFQYLKLTDLKRARLVCHSWCRIGTKLLPSKCRHHLLFGDGKRQFDTFLKLIQSSLYPLPHRTIVLQPSILALNRSQSLESFFSTSSLFLQSLYLTYQEDSHQITGSLAIRDYAQSSFFSSLSELPVLKHLHYEELLPANYYSSPGGKHQRCLKGHVLFERLLRASVNLEKLDLILQDRDVSKTEQHFLALVKCSKTYGTLANLRALMLKVPLHDIHLELLDKADFQRLASIQLRFQNVHFRTSSLFNFFAGCASTLRTLSTNVWEKDRKIYSEDESTFPCLPKLETLEIAHWRSYREEETSLPFTLSYKRSFPQLRKLILQSYAWEPCWNAFLHSQAVCHTLQELRLPKMRVNTGIIPKIANTFPELKRLDVTVMPTSVNILSDIFCFLERLEELCISFLQGSRRRHNVPEYMPPRDDEQTSSVCIDYVMTGIPEAICKKIYAEDRISKVNLDFLETGYSLTSLKYLKSLQLKNLSSIEYGIPQFSDITGYLAILKMARLKTLDIWRSQLSDECVAEMDKTFKLNVHANF